MFQTGPQVLQGMLMATHTHVPYILPGFIERGLPSSLNSPPPPPPENLRFLGGGEGGKGGNSPSESAFVPPPLRDGL